MPITQYNSSVRQMSQSKFNSMKDASGKIPDLANQIVMTNSEDSNISCIRTEVVYDMTSSDASKNWGYPNGIGTGVTINKDFSKYDFLVCEYLSYNNSIVGFCDLSQPTMPSDTTGRYVIYAVAYVQNGYQELIGVINLEKTTLTTYLPGSGTLAVKIAKIYGILKTPSMIYTGDELIAGNGIKIENRVISRIPLFKDYFIQSYSSAFKVTDKTSIGSFTFNKSLNDSNLVINYSCPLKDNSNGYGSYIGVNIDGTQAGAICLRNSSGMFCYNEIARNISSGSHTISFFIGCGAGYTTVPAYENITATIVEVL